MKRVCRKFKREQLKESWRKGRKGYNKVAFDIDVVIIYNDDSMNCTCQDCTCIIDPGISIHVISWCNLFTSYTSSDFDGGRMRNGVNRIMSMEDICLKIGIRC